MSSTLRTMQAPQENTISILKMVFLACRPLSFVAYFLALSLGFFVAHKHVGDASSAVYYVMICMFFCMHGALNLLCHASASVAHEDLCVDERKGTNADIPCRIKVQLSIRYASLFAVALSVFAFMSGIWLMVQSGQIWLCFVLFISIFAAMVCISPAWHMVCRSFGTVFLHGNLCLALFATSYAVSSQDFAPYYLALSVPMSLFMAIFLKQQSYGNAQYNDGTCHVPFGIFINKEKFKIFCRICSLAAWALMLNIITCYVPTVTVERSMLADDMKKSVLDRHSSSSIEASTQDAMDRGVVYGFGVKNSHSGSIDCSGWIAEINQSMMKSMNARMGKNVYGEKAKLTLNIGANGGAAGIVLAVKVVTGQQFLTEDLSPDKVREGLVIGLDTGPKDWDMGRYGGIDHIVQTYKDHETGQMMVSQSSGGVGVHAMPYAEWYAKWSQEAKLYGVDMSLLAEPSPVPSL
ncbi:MAG: hypothetical protein R3Y11_03120 [Pseudomonadota bacterium]